MTEQEARQRLMDYLYDEMSEQKREEFEKHLENNPGLRDELKELRGTRSLLGEVSMDAPQQPDLDSARQPNSRASGSYAKTVLTAAAVLLVGVMIFAFADLQFGQTEHGYYLTFGTPPAQESISEEAVESLVNQLQQENQLMVAAMYEQLSEQQDEQLNRAMADLAEYYEMQRERDLMLVAEGFAQLEEETTDRFIQTNEAIGDIFYALYNQ